MADRSDVVIVGASLAGLTTAEGLRNEGFTGSITLIGAEDHLPYNRPPLSKQVLADTWDVTATTMRDDKSLDELRVRFIRGERATGVDLAARTVSLGDSTISFDTLVIATGVVARRLPSSRSLAGVHVLRTVDDALSLKQDLALGGRVVVVGAGVLGCEIASAAREAGHQVTLVGRTREPRFGSTGGHLSSLIGSLFREHGVQLRMAVDVLEVIGRERVSSVRLSDGSVIPADTVVAAIGCTPVVDWLATSGLDVSDGVLCDSNGVAAPGVYAVGDVARWFDPLSGNAARVEHQATAIEQAHSVARLIATGEQSDPISPFFWSELFGNRILVHGTLAADLPLTVLAGDIPARKFVAATVVDGHPTGLIGWNMPRDFRLERARMLEHTSSSTLILKGSTVA